MKDKLGIDFEANCIYPASYLVAYAIRKKHPNLKKAYVIGEKGITDELEKMGI
jgi:HAD superfamily hydrolase (TIGR01450 family)